MQHHHAIRRLLGLLVVTLTAALFGCEGDDDSGLEVFLTISPTTLSADGTDSADILVTVLRANGEAAPLGTRVVLTCFDEDQTGAAAVGGSSEGVVQLQTDEVGRADSTLTCIGDPTVEVNIFCLARVEDVQERATPVRCVPSE